ncbi:hypothetical protein HOU00_gp092 [Caulobacter phage CcrPW]|uniref:Uncharacterized protein n=1 Tax=Caulobacter phage CcrPW TaxID=2283271 RepID=A0A385E9S2_9CAUD|nr:hypothetical protein HOU00_gp092 [Caulobacter phage CcrPW]AXQ68631.1 hypothetical protein CcrPW_gp092c [Caulobacter phage CcrPW]
MRKIGEVGHRKFRQEGLKLALDFCHGLAQMSRFLAVRKAYACVDFPLNRAFTEA